MLPVLLEIGGLRIHSYGFFIALGYISALVLGRRLAARQGLDPAPFMDLAFAAIASGVVGARALFVITAWSHFKSHPLEILDLWSGGLVFYGGFVLAALVCVGFGAWKKLPLWRSTDIVLTGVALAHGFGRIGCFAAGCCHGSICALPWAISLRSEVVAPALRGQPLHPVQLYEAAALFAMAWLMSRALNRRKLRAGIVSGFYLSGYASIRFFLEYLRGDEGRGFLPGTALSTSQAIAATLFCLGCGILIRRLRSQDL